MTPDNALEELLGRLRASEMVLTGLCTGLLNLGAPYSEIVNLILDESADLIGMEMYRTGEGAHQTSLRACLAALESYAQTTHSAARRSGV